MMNYHYENTEIESRQQKAAHASLLAMPIVEFQTKQLGLKK